MIFHYRPLVTAPPDGGDYLLILRPEIPVSIIGPSGSATVNGLVDTGSDHTILPRSIAEPLGIRLQDAPGPQASVFGGQKVQLSSGDVTLQLAAEGESIRWSLSVYFFDFPDSSDETAILGHSGFLDFFTATFDGKLGILTLVPNSDLPPAP